MAALSDPLLLHGLGKGSQTPRAAPCTVFLCCQQPAAVLKLVSGRPFLSNQGSACRGLLHLLLRWGMTSHIQTARFANSSSVLAEVLSPK